VLIAKTEKVQDKEIRTGEGGGGGEKEGAASGCCFYSCVLYKRPPSHPSVSHPCGFLLRTISVFHLETMDLPFPECLISDPWRNGHLDISIPVALRELQMRTHV
jgi:hypothetical protein